MGLWDTLTQWPLDFVFCHFVGPHFIFKCLFHLLFRFLAGKGAREWGKSKGISMPETISEADAVTIYLWCSIFFHFCSCLFSNLHMIYLNTRQFSHWFFYSCTCFGKLSNCFTRLQWLVTERAKAQWLKYKSMLANAKKRNGSSATGSTKTSTDVRLFSTESGIL